jgi:uncharacterized protein YjdB
MLFPAHFDTSLAQRALALVFAAGCSACYRPPSDCQEVGYQSPSVATVSVSPRKATLAVGQPLEFSATLGDAAGNMLPIRRRPATVAVGPGKEAKMTIAAAKGRAGRTVTWKSSAPLRATVAGGLVTTLSAGSAIITATSEGHSGTAEVVITDQPSQLLSVVPQGATVVEGATLRLGTQPNAGREGSNASISWSSDNAQRAVVDSTGLVKALSVGQVTLTAKRAIETAAVALSVEYARPIAGLDFPGNAGVHKTIRFEFPVPPKAFPATYIWRAYPRQQESYYTALFWANNGRFYPSRMYYGFHPYPDWRVSYRHLWEIASPPGQDYLSKMHVVYDRWYIQVAICDVIEGRLRTDFYWDWPSTKKMLSHDEVRYPDPPTPGLIIGDAPWNSGQEVWNGILRGFQFYQRAMKPQEVAGEIRSPGSIGTPWYLNLNPTPEDISDKSGNNHNPRWVGAERPPSWRGKLASDGIVRTSVPPEP